MVAHVAGLCKPPKVGKQLLSVKTLSLVVPAYQPCNLILLHLGLLPGPPTPGPPTPGPSPAPTPACPHDASCNQHTPIPNPDPGPAPDFKIVGQWLKNYSPKGSGSNMISNGLMAGTPGGPQAFFYPAGSPLPSELAHYKIRYVTYGGMGVGGREFPSLNIVFGKWINGYNCTRSW